MIQPIRIEQYREFLQLMGHRVIETNSCLWINVRPLIFQPAPAFKLRAIQNDDIRHVMKTANAIACRWFSAENELSTSCNQESPTMLYVVSPPYDISNLQPRARTQTRRGLENVTITRTNLDEETAQQAYPVYAENLHRLGLLKSEARLNQRWSQWVGAIRSAECLEFWVARREQRIVAFSVTVQTPWGTELVMQRSSSEALSLFANNALVYTLIKESFKGGAPVVSFGLSAFNGEKEGLYRFKLHMGFNAIPLKEHRAWHPWMSPFTRLLRPQRLRNASTIISRIRNSWMLV